MQGVSYRWCRLATVSVSVSDLGPRLALSLVRERSVFGSVRTLLTLTVLLRRWSVCLRPGCWCRPYSPLGVAGVFSFRILPGGPLAPRITYGCFRSSLSAYPFWARDYLVLLVVRICGGTRFPLHFGRVLCPL